jgi:hypothetical protein
LAERKRPKKKRGPKGGVKHQPGGGHDRKSKPGRTTRFRKKAARKRQQEAEEARRQWAAWDRLDDERKKFFPELKPKLPRPDDG